MRRNHLIHIAMAVLAIVLSTNASANNLEKVDSLLQQYEQYKGKKRIDVGRQLLDIYAGDAVFFDTPPTLSDDNSSQADLLVWFGTERYYTTISYYAEALDYIERALPLSDYDTGIHNTLLCDQSYCLFKRSDYPHSIEVGKEAIECSQRTNDKMQLSRAYLYLSLVNHAVQDYEEAKMLVEKAIEVNEQLGLNVQTHNVLGIACEIFCSAREVERAIGFGQRAVEAACAIGYMPGVANHLMQLSYAYDRQGSYQRGLDAADSAIAIITGSEPLDRNQLAIALEYKSWNLIDIGRHKDAVDALQQAIKLEEEVGNTHAVWNDYRTLYEALEPIDVSQALAVLKRYTKMSDSIHSAQLKELMSQANAQLHNDELKQENEESRRQNRIIMLAALALILLLTAVIASLGFAFRQKGKSAKALQQLATARENFFTNITHELRTPLTIILGYAQQLRNNTSDTTPQAEEVRSAGKMIERGGRQILNLINELLDLAKLQSVASLQNELLPARWCTDNIVAYVRMILEPFYGLASNKGLTLAYSPCEDDIEMDFAPEYMQKVVNNLVSNAMKFTPQGGSITIATCKKGRQFIMTVTDTGTGLTPAQLANIFEPFYQAQPAQEQGTGIGLTLTRQIVVSAGGTITADSTEGEGTTFTVKLPLKSPRPFAKEKLTAAEITKQQQSTDSNTETENTEGNYEMLEEGLSKADSQDNARILVVEDNRDVAFFIGSQLADSPYSISYASNGQQGLDMAEQLVPDLIITDVMMPQMDGLELCRQIRAKELTSHIPVIIITARTSQEELRQGIEAGADAYLKKPFDTGELLLHIEKLLEQRKLLRKKYSRMDFVPKKDGEQTAVQQNNADEKFLNRLTDVVFTLMDKQQVDVDTVAQHLNLSTSQMRRKVVAITGQTPSTYIMQIRMTTAQRLLDQHPEAPINDIALRCGFINQSHFSSTFQKVFGISPSQWAKRTKEQE